jgi:hypothetical protein
MVKPLPGFERHSHVGTLIRPNRYLSEVNGAEKPIDRLNDSMPLGVTLHPTKGYRKRSERSLRAEFLCAELRYDLQAWQRHSFRNAERLK